MATMHHETIRSSGNHKSWQFSNRWDHPAEPRQIVSAVDRPTRTDAYLAPTIRSIISTLHEHSRLVQQVKQ